MEKFELINNYINGKLNLEEKKSLEEALNHDENLRNLLEQESLVKEAVTKYQTIQFKSRMDSISISSGVSNYVKVAASLFILGGISFGAYYYSTFQEQNANTPPNLSSLNKPTTNNSSETIKETEVKTEAKAPEKKAQEKKSPKKAETKASTSAEVNPTVHQEEIDIASPSDFNSSATKSSPDDNLNTSKSLKTDVSLEINSSEELKYRNFNSKLYLIGKFDKKYEIIELKSNQLYLNYDGNFYYLRNNVEKSTNLEKVKNAALLKNLNDKLKNLSN